VAVMALTSDERARKRLLTAYLNTTVTMVRSADMPDLTGRQMAVLLKVYLDDTDQTVRGLATYCEISKPAITRALDRLAEFDYIRRETDPQDRRSVIVKRTSVGQSYIRQIGDILLNPAKASEETAIESRQGQ
jgi:DNA-binding MarR family transcriptional regulator